MQVQENISLAPHTTLQLGGQARYFHALRNLADVPDLFAFAKKKEVEVFILGGGSNTIFADGVIDKLVVKQELKGISFLEDEVGIIAKVAAGENWDKFVAQAVAKGFSGVEALSGIPGTAGAAPVQNIGAYGSEISDVFVSLMAWDREQGEFFEFAREDCEFSYRNSLFKRQPGRFFITEIKLRLRKDSNPPAPKYGSLQAHLEKEGIVNLDLSMIRKAVLAVRATRLPNVEESPNVGSFFTNPIVSKEKADELENEFPNIVRFDLEDNQTKIPAGWLIEQAGFKGKRLGNFRTFPDNALVLIHDGGGTTAELLKAEEEIRVKVKGKFGITLKREPNVVI